MSKSRWYFPRRVSRQRLLLGVGWGPLGIIGGAGSAGSAAGGAGLGLGLADTGLGLFWHCCKPTKQGTVQLRVCREIPETDASNWCCCPRLQIALENGGAAWCHFTAPELPERGRGRNSPARKKMAAASVTLMQMENSFALAQKSASQDEMV